MGERGLYSSVWPQWLFSLQLFDMFSQMGRAFAFELSLKVLILLYEAVSIGHYIFFPFHIANHLKF